MDTDALRNTIAKAEDELFEVDRQMEMLARGGPACPISSALPWHYCPKRNAEHLPKARSNPSIELLRRSRGRWKRR